MGTGLRANLPRGSKPTCSLGWSHFNCGRLDNHRFGQCRPPVGAEFRRSPRGRPQPRARSWKIMPTVCCLAKEYALGDRIELRFLLWNLNPRERRRVDARELASGHKSFRGSSEWSRATRRELAPVFMQRLGRLRNAVLQKPHECQRLVELADSVETREIRRWETAC